MYTIIPRRSSYIIIYQKRYIGIDFINKYQDTKNIIKTNYDYASDTTIDIVKTNYDYAIDTTIDNILNCIKKVEDKVKSEKLTNIEISISTSIGPIQISINKKIDNE